MPGATPVPFAWYVELCDADVMRLSLVPNSPDPFVFNFFSGGGSVQPGAGVSGGAGGRAPAVCVDNSVDILVDPPGVAAEGVDVRGGAEEEEDGDDKTMSSSRPNRFAGFFALRAAATACCFCRPRCSSRR